MTLPTLDFICDEVGIITFSRWNAEAIRHCNSTPYLRLSADACKACRYEYMVNRYNSFLEARKASTMASREVLGQQELGHHTKEHN